MSVRFVLVTAIALLGAWAFAAPATALPPGVHPSPSSPAGEEYSVPLWEWRGPAPGRPVTTGQPPPLFGVGVSPPGSGGAPGTPAQGSSSAAHPHATSGAATRSSARRRSHAGTPARARGGRKAAVSGGAPTGGVTLAGLTHSGSAAPAVGLLAALVVLGGVGVGIALAAAGRRLG